MVQRVICGAIRNPQPGALGERNFVWEQIHLRLVGERILRVRTGKSFSGVDTIAGFYFFYSATDGLHGTGSIGARGIGQLRLDGISSIAHIGVVRIDSGGVYAHQNLPRTRIRSGDFLKFEYFRTAEPVNLNSLHVLPPK